MQLLILVPVFQSINHCIRKCLSVFCGCSSYCFCYGPVSGYQVSDTCDIRLLDTSCEMCRVAVVGDWAPLELMK